MAQSNPLLISQSGLIQPVSTLFFDPDGEIMYVERNGILFAWKLQAREGPKWWLGEG